jgi:Amt family ammonium transporter
VHGVGGCLGVIMLGVFGTTAVNAAGANGLWHGNAMFFAKEALAVIATAVYAFAFSYGSLFVINLFTPVRTGEKEEQTGLDEAQFGETAYLA